jgi:iron complex outermembrane receptor protein
MNFENEIVPSGGLDVFGQPRVGNAGKTHHIGIELEGVYKLPWDFQLSLNGNISRNRYVEFKEYDGNGTVISRNDNYIANAPELILNMGLTYLNENFFAVVNVNHTGVQYTDNSIHPDGMKPTEVTVDPFTVVNFSTGVNYTLSGVRLKLSIEVNNLFDNKYLMNGFGWDNFFPSAGRNLMTNLKVEF